MHVVLICSDEPQLKHVPSLDVIDGMFAFANIVIVLVLRGEIHKQTSVTNPGDKRIKYWCIRSVFVMTINY
jgi:hypothetical protein